MKLLVIDGLNFGYRAKAGFSADENSYSYNFFRNLRALVGVIQPTSVAFVLEGTPEQRNSLYVDYKANRVLDASDPDFVKKAHEKKVFFENYNYCVSLMKSHFPIYVVRHARFECDDVAHNLALKFVQDNENSTAVISSSDTDFIQSPQRDARIHLYNPTSKKFIAPPEHDYVAWKSLKGDEGDNIIGIKGIGEKTAAKLLKSENAGLLETLFKNDEKKSIFDLNMKLVKFHEFGDEEWSAVNFTCAESNWAAVKAIFEHKRFETIVSDKQWKKFVETFESANSEG